MDPFSDVFPMFYDPNDYRVNQKSETINNKLFDEKSINYSLADLPEKYQNNGVPDIVKKPDYKHNYVNKVETFMNPENNNNNVQIYYFLLLIIFILVIINYQQYKLIKKVIKSSLPRQN